MNNATTPQEILQFWFGGDGDTYRQFWFDRSADDCILQKYSQTLLLLEETPYLWTDSDENTLAHIIVLDQFSRSIYRGTPDIYKNDSRAFFLAKRLIENGYDLKTTLSHRLFMLMPYRHQRDSDLLDIVMKKLDAYENELGKSPLLTRFRNATLMSYTPLTDRIERCYYSVDDDKDDNTYLYEYFDVLDKKCVEYKENTSSLSCLKKTLETFVRQRDIKRIGVSLSGGVDSMVILYLLHTLRNEGLFEEVYAMHLEYNNRKESPRETELIGIYCARLKIPFFLRTIHHMSRDSVDRSFYEEETKKIRFATYRNLSKKYDISGWCLGHHRGDVSENVLMNLYNGRDILDLTVMKTDSEMDGVTLYRPLLGHLKSEIYDIAHTHCIPYMKDTTPEWSCRGVIRRQLLPLMKSQWPSIETTLETVGRQSDEWSSVIEHFVMDTLKKGIVMDEQRDTVCFTLKKEYINFPKVIWTNLFLTIFHNMGVRMISRKNLVHFMESFSRNWEKRHQFNFSNGCLGTFEKDVLRINKGL
jgi:tRNA(Ile)-lysidine synthetase-like protein